MAIDKVRDAFMKVADGNKDLARVLFGELAKEAKMEHVAVPSDLKSIEDAEKVFTHLKLYQEKSSSVAE
jgi:hypothetical protein